MSGVINNRLLCQMMTHDMFWRLMADIEIYVDRIASRQIDNINLVVDTAREELLARVQPEERDRYVHTLESAHVNEAEYFAHAVHADIDSIMKDIHEAHRGVFGSGDFSQIAPGEKSQFQPNENSQRLGMKLVFRSQAFPYSQERWYVPSEEQWSPAFCLGNSRPGC